jgi:regulator of extracellular matrix RemA (YlzA/DUF370 family)
MSNWIQVGEGGVIDKRRVVAIGRVRSAPILRLLKSTDPTRILVLTYGYPRQSVLLLDNGYLAIVSTSLEDLLATYHGGQGDDE